jgi:3-oxoacyl-[acyl-carrier protein] reductase
VSDGRRAPVVLVTGASSGIGRATALRFAHDGFRVAVNYASHEAAALEAAAAVDGRAYRCDVADADAVASMVAEVEDDLGPIDVAVCNAGFYAERRLEDIDDELWDRSLRVMLGGCFHVARAVVPPMRSRGTGSIVTVASELALIGGVEVAHYVAAKAAIIGLTRSLARELGPTIRVNAVAPGAVDTPLLPDRDRGPGYTDTLPLRRIGRSEEIADVIRLLASSSWTTGAVWSIDGGAAIQ